MCSKKKDIVSAKAKSCYNVKELNRYITYLGTSLEHVLNKCYADDEYCKTVAYLISIESTRQGGSFEKHVFTSINKCVSTFGITVNNLSTNSSWPIKNTSDILSDIEMKQQKINKKKNGMKSFDAKISGKTNGYISHKTIRGSGGHQDNVWNELNQLCQWIMNNEKYDSYLFAIIIDTTPDIAKTKVQKLKDLYIKTNLFIGSSVEFQKHLINEYYTNDS